ncbi:hypothetical protein RhiirA1_480027 [Rhizophagus irregularis]|uniref:Uncharacterized protein n=1 Tax=Rhizophagus irregularis TaxID=588596 RepID=A0A2N0QPW6_9GLOM|nr:hypothetical protein RhiirA1_480027 [Rhizophagus irregularis]
MPRNSKQYNYFKKARYIHLNQKNLVFSKININENLLEDTNIDEYQNSNQQILQLTNDQCFNEKHTIDK